MVAMTNPLCAFWTSISNDALGRDRLGTHAQEATQSLVWRCATRRRRSTCGQRLVRVAGGCREVSQECPRGLKKKGFHYGKPLISLMELRGIEPHSSESPLDASSLHTPAQITHIRALRPSRDPQAASHDAPKRHEQHTGMHGQRAPGVHADLHAVIAAWPTLSEGVRATILRLVEEEGGQR